MSAATRNRTGARSPVAAKCEYPFGEGSYLIAPVPEHSSSKTARACLGARIKAIPPFELGRSEHQLEP